MRTGSWIAFRSKEAQGYLFQWGASRVYEGFNISAYRNGRGQCSGIALGKRSQIFSKIEERHEAFVLLK